MKTKPPPGLLRKESKSAEKLGYEPIVFFAEGDYIVSGGSNETRRWRMKDGKEVGQPMALATQPPFQCGVKC